MVVYSWRRSHWRLPLEIHAFRRRTVCRFVARTNAPRCPRNAGEQSDDDREKTFVSSSLHGRRFRSLWSTKHETTRSWLASSYAMCRDSKNWPKVFSETRLVARAPIVVSAVDGARAYLRKDVSCSTKCTPNQRFLKNTLRNVAYRKAPIKREVESNAGRTYGIGNQKTEEDMLWKARAKQLKNERSSKRKRRREEKHRQGTTTHHGQDQDVSTEMINIDTGEPWDDAQLHAFLSSRRKRYVTSFPDDRHPIGTGVSEAGVVEVWVHDTIVLDPRHWKSHRSRSVQLNRAG